MTGASRCPRLVGSGGQSNTLVRVQHAAILGTHRDPALAEDVRRLDRLSVPHVYHRRHENDPPIAVHMARRVCWGTRTNGYQEAEDADARKDSGRPEHGPRSSKAITTRRVAQVTIRHTALQRADGRATALVQEDLRIANMTAGRISPWSRTLRHA